MGPDPWQPYLQGGFIWDWRDQALIKKGEAPKQLKDSAHGKARLHVAGKIVHGQGLVDGVAWAESGPDLSLDHPFSVLVNFTPFENWGVSPLVSKGLDSYGIRLVEGGGFLEFYLEGKELGRAEQSGAPVLTDSPFSIAGCADTFSDKENANNGKFSGVVRTVGLFSQAFTLNEIQAVALQ